MKRKALTLVVLAAVLASGLWWLLAPDRAPPVSTPGDSGALKTVKAPGLQGSSAGAPQAPGVQASGGTPQAGEPMREEDGSLQVEVVSAAGPHPGARVTLYFQGAGPRSWFLAGSGVTGAAGRVALPARPGHYLVTARAGGLATARARVTRPRGEATTPVRLTLEAGASLEGTTVERGSGAPVPLAELTLTPRTASQELSSSAAVPEEELHTTASDARGSFRFQGLAPGEYQLEARAPGRAPRRLARVHVPSSGVTVELDGAAFIEGFVTLPDGRPATEARVVASGTGEAVEAGTSEGGGFALEVPPGVYQLSARQEALTGAAPERITVGAGMTVRDVRIALGGSASLVGLVRRKGSGEPIAGAAISVTLEALTPGPPPEEQAAAGSAVSSAEGRFAVDGLAPGLYSVTVRARGFKKLVRGGIRVLAGQRFGLTAELDATGRIEGTVVDGRQQPLAGVHVTAEGRWRRAPLEGTLVTVTEAQGGFVLEDVPPGDVYVAARRPGSETHGREPVKVLPGETSRVRLQLSDEGLLEGTVRLTGGRVPPRPVTVSALRVGAPWSEGVKVPATPEGAWQLRLGAGRYRLTAWMTEMGNQSGDQEKVVELQAGRTERVELEVREARKPITVTVLEPNGAPSVGATVMGSEVGSNELVLEDVTDASGQVTVVADAVGGSALRLWATNGGRRGELPSVPTSRTAVTLPLSAGGRLSGTVRWHGGRGVEEGFRLVVAAVRGDDDYITRQELEFTGDRFVVEDVTAGRVAITATEPGGRAGRTEATVTAGATTQVEVILEAGGGLTGRLVDASGTPLPGAFVEVDGRTAQAGVDGRFRLEDLTAGPHLVTAWGRGGRLGEKGVTVTQGKVVDLGDWRMGPARVEPGRLGLFFAMRGDDVAIHWLAEGGPAAAALRVGDVVKAIDGAPVLDPGEARHRELGTPGSPATLLILRDGRTSPVTLNRAL